MVNKISDFLYIRKKDIMNDANYTIIFVVNEKEK